MIRAVCGLRYGRFDKKEGLTGKGISFLEAGGPRSEERDAECTRLTLRTSDLGLRTFSHFKSPPTGVVTNFFCNCSAVVL